MAVNEETVSILPFSSLSDWDFNHLLGNWSAPNLDEINDLYNLLPNPDKADESDPDLMPVSPCSEYYSIKKLNNLLKKSGSKLFIFHCILEVYRRILISLKKFWISLCIGSLIY